MFGIFLYPLVAVFWRPPTHIISPLSPLVNLYVGSGLTTGLLGSDAPGLRLPASPGRRSPARRLPQGAVLPLVQAGEAAVQAGDLAV